MSEAQAASAFSFTEFKVPEFNYYESIRENGELTIDIRPQGFFVKDRNEYRLILEFNAFDNGVKNDDDEYVIKLRSLSCYQFYNNEKFEEIPNYFFQSCLAVTFPFVRSFIAAVTAQSDAKRMLLPLLNLTMFGEDLKKNTTILKSEEMAKSHRRFI